MQRVHQIAEKKDAQVLTDSLTKDGEVPMPMVELQDGQLVVRSAVSALLVTERSFRRILGYERLRVLKATLVGSEAEQR